MEIQPFRQDLHIHTTFSCDDPSMVEAQTPEMVAQVKHAEVIGISDHFEHIVEHLDAYTTTVAHYGLHVGTEVNGGHWAAEAAVGGLDYYLQHTTRPF